MRSRDPGLAPWREVRSWVDNPRKPRRSSTMTAVLGGATVEELRQSIRGAVVAPGDADYDAARAVWNGMIDRRPALVVRCAEVGDVVAAVRFARSQGLEIAVRGGG